MIYWCGSLEVSASVLWRPLLENAIVTRWIGWVLCIRRDKHDKVISIFQFLAVIKLMLSEKDDGLNMPCILSNWKMGIIQ